jgi:predicted nucleic acid-binding protein
MKCLLDTSVYIGAFRSGETRVQFRETFVPLIPQTFLSAVVAYELYVNAKDRSSRRLVGEFVAPMERSARIVSPAFADWLKASEIVTDIVENGRQWRSKLPALLNDILIALCARRIGATLFTYNKDDFMLIQRHYDFSLRVLAPLGSE